MAAMGVQVGRLKDELKERDSVFLEPFQVLSLLRRAMAVCPESTDLDPNSVPGLQVLFNALRFAADVSRVKEVPSSPRGTTERWLEVAAGLMPRLWLGEQPNVNLVLARTRIMLRAAESDPKLAPKVAKLKSRMLGAVGLSFDDVTTLAMFVSYWSGVRKLSDIFSNPTSIMFNPETFLAKTTISKAALESFLTRTARVWSDVIADSEIGGPIGHLPFRDRPFLRFRNGTVAAIMPELVAEKLSGDIFWWLKDPDVDQQDMWQADWGQISEEYILRVLQRIATGSHASLFPRIQLRTGEIDAAVCFKRHLALVEITTSRIGDPAANSGDTNVLRQALKRTFVGRERLGQEPYREAVLQLARDIDSVLTDRVSQIPLPNTDIQRLYPIMIATDKRVRTPGVWQLLDAELREALKAEHATKVAALVVLSVEDLEEMDQAVRDRPLAMAGSPPGVFKLLRRWDFDRGVAPSWWQFIQPLYPSYRRNSFLDDEAKGFGSEIEDKFWDKS